MSAINYSKWDDLEISDDSDIECHPNVDKRSMIRWKQEQIHREREERRNKIKDLSAEVLAIKQQLSRMETLQQKVKEEGVEFIVKTMNEFKAMAASSNALTPENEEKLNLVQQDLDQEQACERYMEKMNEQYAALQKRFEEADKQLRKLEALESKKLTSDKLVTGFDKTAVTKAPQPPKEPAKPPKKTIEKTKVIETLNPGSAGGVPAKAASSSTTSSKPTPKQAANDESDSDDDDEVEVSGVALEFSRLKGFDASLTFISKHPYLGTQKYSDEIMAQAFKAQMEGDETYANNCVHQALILQYCAQLGKDGVGLFFHRIRDPSHAALKIFQNDWKDTYTRIKDRCKVLAQERAANAAPGVETIQLQATDPGTQIHITGPPEDADPKVHEIFAALPEDFQEAIMTGSLDNVNKSLEGMSVELAEEVVRVCNQVGFLSIEGEIIDTTNGETIEGREAAVAAAKEAEEAK
ncbi:hsp90 co-chaperone Cdc37 [Podila minutissima]|uniref:Hsp90 chaperone protein kinase-targeting subunit n=1 Tax=Podila minutissima TaxID=64525 RepID=A0A9P5SRD5_9FUNG|nr:hsp90 co-chaperone Cdc37 [Podila minutissima]